jgi:hypothetical protein
MYVRENVRLTSFRIQEDVHGEARAVAEHALGEGKFELVLELIPLGIQVRTTVPDELVHNTIGPVSRRPCTVMDGEEHGNKGVEG